MSLNVLGPRALRRLSRITGRTIIHATVNSSHRYWMRWLTTDRHEHGFYDMSTGTWGFDKPGECDYSPSSCRRLFPARKS